MVKEIWVQSQFPIIPKTLIMVRDASLLNTQQYKVLIKGKVEQSRKRGSALPLHFSVVAIEKGAFKSPSAKVGNFTTYIDISFYELIQHHSSSKKKNLTSSCKNVTNSSKNNLEHNW